MKIERIKKNNSLNFANLSIGDVFELNGRVYLKIYSYEVMVNNTLYTMNAVNLERNELTSIVETNLVTLIKCNLVETEG